MATLLAPTTMDNILPQHVQRKHQRPPEAKEPEGDKEGDIEGDRCDDGTLLKVKAKERSGVLEATHTEITAPPTAMDNTLPIRTLPQHVQWQHKEPEGDKECVDGNMSTGKAKPRSGVLEATHTEITEPQRLSDKRGKHSLFSPMPMAIPNPSPRCTSDDVSEPGAFSIRGMNYVDPTTSSTDIEIGCGGHAPVPNDDDNNNNDNHGLVEATPVTAPKIDATADQIIITTTTDNASGNGKTRTTRASTNLGAIICVALFFFLLIGVSLLVGILTRTNKVVVSVRDDPERNETRIPLALAVDPLLARLLPNSTLEIILHDMAAYGSMDNGQDSNSSNNNDTAWSPQYKAYRWILNDTAIRSYSDEQLLQRYALASIFHSASGNNWTSQIRLLNSTNATTSHSAAGDSVHPNTPSVVGSINPNPYHPWLQPHHTGIHECQWWSFNEVSPPCGNGSSYLSLDLEENNLVGQLPPEVGLLTTLETLNLGHNNELTGTIVTELGQLVNLQTLDLGLAKLTGTIPTELSRLNSLQYLAVMYNQLTGTFPHHLLALSNLKELKLGFNHFHGTVPDCIGTQLHKLESFSIPGNSFNSTLPSSLTSCSTLTRIDIAENQFTGELPTELGTLTQLTRMFFPNNRFSGAVPSELALLPSLAKLNLHNNINLTGPLPPEFAALNKSLTVFQIQGTSITGTIPPELCGIKKLRFECSESLCGCDCPCQ